MRRDRRSKVIKRLDVDGVPALVGSTTGPGHAGLVFRVGSADEPPRAAASPI
jgi:hypothetical protein